MLTSVLLLAICFPPVSLARNLISSNAFLDVDKITSRASVKITVDGSPHCSGTIISSNLVYTAAHCLHGYRVGSLRVYTASDLKRGYELEEVYIPAKFQTGEDFHKNVANSCDPDECEIPCRKTWDKLVYYKNHYDYALILLKEELPICMEPEGPVAGAFQYPLVSKNAHSYVPGKNGNECFVAGFGHTEHKPSKIGNISLASISHFDGYYEEPCDQPTHKAVITRFHTSNESNPYETEVCGGDSGSGIQCISKGGRQLSVIGVNIQVAGPGVTPENACWKPRDSYSLSVKDHVTDVFQVIDRWGETVNFKKWGKTCSTFLKKNPYNSVMMHYLNRPAEF